MRHVFLDCFVDRLNVVVRIFWAEKIHTRQFDVLSVHQDRGGDGTFVDVLNVDVSFPAPFVQHNSDCVFVVEFSTSHQRKQTNHKIRWDISGRNGRAPSRVLLSPMSIMLSRTRKSMALWWCTVYNVSWVSGDVNAELAADKVDVFVEISILSWVGHQDDPTHPSVSRKKCSSRRDHLDVTVLKQLWESSHRTWDPQLTQRRVEKTYKEEDALEIAVAHALGVAILFSVCFRFCFEWNSENTVFGQ